MEEFFVIGKPQGKARPRFGNGRTYTPRTTLEYESRIACLYRGKKMDGEIWIDITAEFQVPKSYTKKQKAEIKKGALPQKKPDSDNIAKVVMDALNGVAYYDDKQVVELRVKKVYSFEREGLNIAIGEKNEITKLPSL